jgi:hypothetical protein
MDSNPSGLLLSPSVVTEVFAGGFTLQNARKSRRRLVMSHWYWLIRA